MRSLEASGLPPINTRSAITIYDVGFEIYLYGFTKLINGWHSLYTVTLRVEDLRCGLFV